MEEVEQERLHVGVPEAEAGEASEASDGSDEHLPRLRIRVEIAAQLHTSVSLPWATHVLLGLMSP